MLWVIFGLVIGIVIGINTNYSIPDEYIKYTAVMTIAIIDFLLSAIKSEVKKSEYNAQVIFTGLLYNLGLAVGITYLGEKLGLDLYLAASIYFIFHIFTNTNEIRKIMLNKNGKNSEL